MSRLSNAAAIEVQSWYRVALAKKAAKVLFNEHEEECNGLATRIQSLVRVNIAKRKFKRSISSTIVIQCFFRVIIAKRKTEKAIQMHYNSEKKNQSIVASCSKLLALIGIAMLALCFLRNSTIIDNSKKDDIGFITSSMKDEIIVPSIEHEIIVPSLEHMKGAVKIGVLRSGVGITDDFSKMVHVLRKNNNIEIADCEQSEEGKQQDIIESDEKNKIDYTVEKVISQEKLEIIKPLKEAVVDFPQESNIPMKSEEDFTEFQSILSEWKDVVLRDATVSIPSDSGNKIYNLTVSPDVVEECSDGNEEKLETLEIMKEFAKQFRSEHILSVQNFASGYI